MVKKLNSYCTLLQLVDSQNWTKGHKKTVVRKKQQHLSKTQITMFLRSFYQGRIHGMPAEKCVKLEGPQSSESPKVQLYMDWVKPLSYDHSKP